MSIQRFDPRPRYHQLADLLRRKIRIGELPPGSQLPTETDLASTYRSSRGTVRLALGVLRNEGLIQSEQGRGSFVRNDRPIHYNANQLGSRSERVRSGSDSFTTMVERQGVHGTHQDVTCETLTADEEIAALLGLEDDLRVLARRRVMWANNSPSMIGDSYYPLSFVQDSRLPDSADIPEGDDQELEDVGHVAVRYHDQITTRMPHPEETTTLEIPPGVPVARVVRTSYESDGTPCETYIQILPGDRYILDYDIPNE
ncbi:MAG: GntR family transcriptional regulator [Pseudonocardiales bacterium]